MKIDGTTRLYAIVADPIAQVKTPQSINAAFLERGFNGVLVPAHVTQNDLETFFTAIRRIQNFNGMVVTVPHKQAAAKLCDELTGDARQVGAVNVVRREPDGRLVGDILDGKGFVRGLLSQNIHPKGKKVFLAGAGGAACAIAFALADAGVAQIGVYNRTLSKALDLQARVKRSYPDFNVVALGQGRPVGYDLIVNATSLGMKDSDPLPLDVTSLQNTQIVAEVIMKPEHTTLLQIAKKCGCQTQPGAPMLEQQLDLMINFMEQRSRHE